MHKSLAGLAAMLIAACGAPGQPEGAPEAVDAASAGPSEAGGGPYSLYTGGRIYTGLANAASTEAVLVGGDGRIVATGRTSELRGRVPVIASEIDLDGATMFPGFVDGHAHLLGIGQRELTLDLSGTTSLERLVRRIARETRDAAPGTVIFGRGWIETDWPEGRMPSAIDLDSASPDNPVILVRADGHALVANTAAMEQAGIDNETPDPSGGRIERDETGAATGIFVDNAMAALLDLVGAPSRAERETALAVGASVYASRGWTGLHNMSVSPRDARLMEGLDEEGRLPIRVYNSFDESGLDLASERKYETDTIRNRAVKIYMDGALGSRGALLFEPYADRPDTQGLAVRGKDATIGLMAAAREARVQVAVHAIGDKANAEAIDWIAETFGEPEAARAARWRVEHAQIVRPQDIARFAEFGIISSMQPSHAIGDLKFAPDRLGLDRLAGAYAWKSFLRAGAVVVAGSDAPVEVGSPMIEFYAATVRKTLEGTSGPGWHPEEAVTRAEALRMLTASPAYASFQDGELGTIEAGKWADFSVFDRDLMRIPADQILETQPVMTVVGGQVVWQVE